jgi:glycosyltransferase involved in cell wall biosynthesis
MFPYRGICKDIDILGGGSLTSLKRYSIWVDVAGAIADKRAGLNAVLCGKGPEGPALKQKILDNRWQHNLRMEGEVPHQDLLGLMQRCKVFLHPSSYEGFSTACLEALYAGAHVVSFTCPTHGLLDHWHVVYSPEEMEAVALQLLEDPFTDYSPVYPHSMEDNASAVMNLFYGKGVVAGVEKR